MDVLCVLLGSTAAGMSGKNSHDHLLAAQQRVADELAGAQGDGGVGVGHLDEYRVSCEVDDQDREVRLMLGFFLDCLCFLAGAARVELAKKSGPVSP